MELVFILLGLYLNEALFSAGEAMEVKIIPTQHQKAQFLGNFILENQKT